MERLRRIVMIVDDLSTIGGIQSRTRKTLDAATDRSIEYVCLGRNNKRKLRLPSYYAYSDDPDLFHELLNRWRSTDTVIAFPNNAIRPFDERLREKISSFPLIFIGSGQLSFFLQDSPVLADVEYTRSLRVSKRILMSKADALVYQQLGLYDYELGFHPVNQRVTNTFDPARNKRIGYVGRIDFPTKGSERLITAAQTAKEIGLGPLRIYTTADRKNSPSLDEFVSLIRSENLERDIEIHYDETDLDEMYSELALLLLPSKKDSFPNTVLEAYSYGIPVVSMSYAPGPSELVLDGETGFLLDSFRADSLKPIFSVLRPEHLFTLLQLSHGAFERHKIYGMGRYFDFFEKVATEARDGFTGKNKLPVYPELFPISSLADRVASAEREAGDFRHRFAHANELAIKRLAIMKERSQEVRSLQNVIGTTNELATRRLEIMKKRSQEVRSLKDEIGATRQSLEYRLGHEIVSNARRPRDWYRIPYAIYTAYRQHKRAEKTPNN